MAKNRREEKERLRQIRLEAEQREASEQRRKLLLGYGVAGLLGAAVVVGIAIVVLSGGGDGASGGAHISAITGDTHGLQPDERDGPEPPILQNSDLDEAAATAGCDLREDLPIEGRTHISPEDPEPKYRTNPPTSGNHIEPPLQQADGAYMEPADPVNVVHSLEHGRLAVQYSPGLPEEAQLELRGLYDTIYGGALLFPNPDMPYDVAVTAWGNLMGCDSYRGESTIDAIRLFGLEHWGQGPEPVEGFGPFDEATPGTPVGAT
jgi:hypothetical protein